MRIHRGTQGEVQVRHHFVGSYAPKPPNKKHAENFSLALQAALEAADEARDQGLLPDMPTEFRTEVRYEATIAFSSPGDVGEYFAIVTEI